MEHYKVRINILFIYIYVPLHILCSIIEDEFTSDFFILIEMVVLRFSLIFQNFKLFR